MRESAFFSARARLAPAKPPPTTTTRGAAWPSAGAPKRTDAAAAEAADARNWRRVGGIAERVHLPSFLPGVPVGNGLDFSIGEAFGDAVHHGCGLLPGLEGLHLGDDVGGLPARERR